MQLAAVHRHNRFGHRGEHPAFTRSTLTNSGEVVQTNNHVLRWHRHRTAVGGLQNVVRRQHQHTGFRLSLDGERKVNGHLVTVEVRVERGTHQRVQLNRFTLHQLRLKRLDSQTVQSRSAVEQHRALANDFFQHIPHLGAGALHHTLGVFDVARVTEVHQTLNHKRLKQLERHQLRQTTLVQLQLGTNHDDGAARVVHTLTE